VVQRALRGQRQRAVAACADRVQRLRARVRIPKARDMFERGLENAPKNEQLRQALASLTT
jgi:hypothetical protein